MSLGSNGKSTRIWSGATAALLAFGLTALGACAQPAPAPAPAAPPTAAAEQPRAGGQLTFIVGAEPPSFDGHRETTFAMLHPTAPHYSLLLKFDQNKYPAIMGDLAETWSVSQDGLTYTFKLRDGIKFHDGAALTAADVKATYDRIVAPPQGVVSSRQAAYGAVLERVEAPDPKTLVFKLKQPSAALLSNLASPWNFIYKAQALAQEARFPEKNILGTGPFRFGEYVPGSHWTGTKNPDYFQKGRPYLDGFRAVFIREASAQVAAVRGGRAQIEFRGFTPPQREDLVKALGKDITVQESPWVCVLVVSMNTEKKPFNDPKFRRALTLALDRWEGSKALSQIAFVKEVGAVMRPGSPFAMPEQELTKLAGFGKDAAAAKAEARRLIQEAGVPEGFSFALTNRDIPMPYEPVAVFLIDQWGKVGLKVSQAVRESSPYLQDLRGGNYEAALDFNCDFMDEPDLQLIKFLPKEKSPINYGRYSDPVLDDLYTKQSLETNPERRKQLVWQFERRALDEMAYQFPTLWWQRIIPHSSQVRGWRITPSHYLNQDLTDVWLAEK